MKSLGVLVELINKELEQGLPGAGYHLLMAPEGRSLLSFNNNSRQAAVLLLVFPSKESTFNTLLIKRPKYNGIHSNQVSFPGGKAEFGDKDIFQTALRETQEEVGIPANLINLIGKLTLLYIPLSNMVVTPIIGYINTTPLLKPDYREVEYCIEIPLKKLVAEGNKSLVHTMPMTIDNTETNVPCYNYNSEIIWGATAMILNEFTEIIRRTGYFTTT